MRELDEGVVRLRDGDHLRSLVLPRPSRTA
jgi:hypothetical protein